MNRVYGSQDHVWLSVYGGLVTMGLHGRSEAREVIVIAQRERERESRSSGLSSMVPLGDGAAEMARWRHSTEVVGGAPMERWFRVQGGEIGAGWMRWIIEVLSLHLLLGRSVAVELQWCRLWEMKIGKGGDGVWPFSEGRRWGGSTVPEVHNTTKSGAADREAEGGG
jgi:hypothetical protein